MSQDSACVAVNPPVHNRSSRFWNAKASPRNGPPHKIHNHFPQNDGSVVIEVTAAARFLHLNGFQFAGEPLEVIEDQGRSNSRPQNNNRSNTRLEGVGSDQSNGDLFARVSRPQNNNQYNSHTTQSPGPQNNLQGRSNFRSQSTPQTNRQFSSNLGQQSTPQNPKASPLLQIPKGPGRFEDPDRIAENFLRAFFPLYDNSRELALKQFYDDNSQFSLSITMRGANRQRKPLDWSEYLKRSRNLTKVHRAPVRAARLFKGQEAIYHEWSQLPKTIHPTFEGLQLAEWLLECKQATNLPDPTGVSPAGVNGLLIIAHGAIEDLSKDGVVSKRSFDRTFVLGPGAGLGGIRVISDALVLRPYSGNFASLNALPPITSANPNPQNVNPVPNGGNVSTPIVHPEVPAGSGIGEPQPGKSEEQLIKEQKVLALSFETGLKLQVAEQCLSGNNWDMEAAKANLQTLLSTQQIPPEAFLSLTATSA